MKTLDEVIKALEICIGYYCSNAEHDVCPYFGESDMGCMKEPEKDALHYLKVLQKMQKAQPVTKGEWDELYNSPLTWDELRQMKGKPVWIEINCLKRWYILADFNAFEPEEVKQKLYGIDKVCFCMELEKDSCGTQWQAYRKER